MKRLASKLSLKTVLLILCVFFIIIPISLTFSYNKWEKYFWRWLFRIEVFLYMPEEPGRVSRLSITPDGSKLIYALFRELVIISLGDNQINSLADIYKNVGYQPRGPIFSKDGNSIVFDMIALPEEKSSDLYIYNFSDGLLRRLTHTPAWEYGASFSPDGSEIFFFRAWRVPRWKGYFRYNIYRMYTNGQGERPVIEGGFKIYTDSSISVSPDGRKLIFSGSVSVTPRSVGFFEQIYSVDLDKGATIKQITQGEIFHTDPSFSPDGRRIAYIQWGAFTRKPPTEDTAESTYEVWIMDSDGSNPTPLTTNKFMKKSPVFSPDGKRIYFIGWSQGSPGFTPTELWVVDTDGKNPHRIAPLEPSKGS